MENLKTQLRIYKAMTGKSFKTIAAETSISYKTLTNFSSGYRDLPEKYIEVLRKYLMESIE